MTNSAPRPMLPDRLPPRGFARWSTWLSVAVLAIALIGGGPAIGGDEGAPTTAQGYNHRGAARQKTGDVDGAIADYTKAIGLDRKSASAYALRGAQFFNRRAFVESIPDLRAAIEYDGEGTSDDGAASYLWLARAFVGQRAVATTELRAYVAALTPTRRSSWRATAARFLMGDIAAEDLLKSADASPPTEREHRCEALFYTGMLQLVDGKQEPAKESLTRCVFTGKKTLDEYGSALAFLERMK